MASTEPAAREPEARADRTQTSDSFERASARVCVVWLVRRVGFWLLVVTGLVAARSNGALEAEVWTVWVFSPSPAWLIPAVHVLLAFFSYRALGYRLREHDLLVRRGLVTREYVAIPFARVQQVDVASGPIERPLGLATLVVHTAGTRTADTQIPGLARDRATALRDHLSRRSDELAE